VYRPSLTFSGHDVEIPPTSVSKKQARDYAKGGMRSFPVLRRKESKRRNKIHKGKYKRFQRLLLQLFHKISPTAARVGDGEERDG